MNGSGPPAGAPGAGGPPGYAQPGGYAYPPQYPHPQYPPQYAPQYPPQAPYPTNGAPPPPPPPAGYGAYPAPGPAPAPGPVMDPPEAEGMVEGATRKSLRCLFCCGDSGVDLPQPPRPRPAVPAPHTVVVPGSAACLPSQPLPPAEAAALQSRPVPASGVSCLNDVDATAPSWQGPRPPATQLGPFLRFGGYEPTTRQFKVSVLALTHQSKTTAPPSLKFKDGSTFRSDGAVVGVHLDHYQGWDFWRFNLVVEAGQAPRTVEYYVELPTDSRLKHHKRSAFVVPAAHQPWHWGFHSCNGFDDPSKGPKAGGIQPLWRDVRNLHAQKPLHVLVGGGDQLYNDPVWKMPSLVAWTSLPDISQRYVHPFTQEMANQVSDYYFNAYANHWSEPEFTEALASIPQIMTWDDHDIWDGWGSYPTVLQNCDVFQGIFNVARRFYCLFQQHSTPERMAADNDAFGGKGWSFLTCLGDNTALLMIDCRSERSETQVASPETWAEARNRLLSLPTTVRHVVVVVTVPMIYPQLPVVEAALKYMQGDGRSRGAIVAMLQKTGLADSLMSQFDTIEILDDLMDHWTAEKHVQEKVDAVHMMQSLSLSRGFRFSLISGDVHVGGMGRFLTNPKQNLRTDHRYIPQIISSAIGNVPPPEGVVNALEAFAASKMTDPETKEAMVQVFGVQKVLCAARNWVAVGPPAPQPGAGLPDHSLIVQFRVEAGEPGSTQRVETYEVQIPPLDLVPGASGTVGHSGQLPPSHSLDPSLLAASHGVAASGHYATSGHYGYHSTSLPYAPHGPVSPVIPPPAPYGSGPLPPQSSSSQYPPVTPHAQAYGSGPYHPQ